MPDIWTYDTNRFTFSVDRVAQMEINISGISKKEIIMLHAIGQRNPLFVPNDK